MSTNFVHVPLFLCAQFFTFAVFICCDPAIRLNIRVSPSCEDEKYHIVNCTLDTNQTSTAEITSLAVYGCTKYDNECEFDPIVAISIWKNQPQLFQGINASNINVTGKMGIAGDSISQIMFT